MGLKLIGNFSSSVLIMQTQRGKSFSLHFQQRRQVWALAPYQWLVLGFFSSPCFLEAGLDVPAAHISMHWPGPDLPPFLISSLQILCCYYVPLPSAFAGLHSQLLAVCMRACVLDFVQFFGTLCTVPSRRFCPWGSLGKNNWSGLPFSSSSGFSRPRIEPVSPCVGGQII